MGKHLDEIMMMSDKGYIDSFDDIEKLTERVMNIDARTLTIKGGYDLNIIADDLISFNELPDTFRYPVRICDIFNMAYAQECSDRAKLLFEYICERYTVLTAELLNRASYSYSDIKLFLSISVKAFADFMDKRSGKKDCKCKKMYKKIIETAKESAHLEVNEKTTIMAIIDGVRPYITQWNPGMRIDIFVFHAENCCRIIKQIFVDFILAGYEDMFDFIKLRENFIELEEKIELEIEESMDYLVFDEEELPFDMDNEAAEFEQLSIEFQALSEDTGRVSDKESNGESDSSADITSSADKK